LAIVKKAARESPVAIKWYLTFISGARVLFNGDARSREELEELAAEVRRQRPEVEILIIPPIGRVYHWE